MKKAVQVVLINDNGEILAVSRKDNHNDFGLIGGKCEPHDINEEAAAIRECKEETGIDIFNLKLIFAMYWGGRMQYTFVADYNKNQEIFHNEPHAVKWCKFKEVLDGSFGEFNQLVGMSLINAGFLLLK